MVDTTTRARGAIKSWDLGSGTTADNNDEATKISCMGTISEISAVCSTYTSGYDLATAALESVRCVAFEYWQIDIQRLFRREYTVAYHSLSDALFAIYGDITRRSALRSVRAIHRGLEGAHKGRRACAPSPPERRGVPLPRRPSRTVEDERG